MRRAADTRAEIISSLSGKTFYIHDSRCGILLSVILILQAQVVYPSRELYNFRNNTFKNIENTAICQNGQTLPALDRPSPLGTSIF